MRYFTIKNTHLKQELCKFMSESIESGVTYIFYLDGSGEVDFLINLKYLIVFLVDSILLTIKLMIWC